MKLLILTQYFPPEVGAPQNRLFELAIRLQKLGIEIEVLTAMPNYPKGIVHPQYRGEKFLIEDVDGVKVYRSSIYATQSKSIIHRLRNYFSFVYSSYKVGRKKLDKKYDYILCESPPLFLGLSALQLCKAKKAKLIFNVSDLWPESAEKLGVVTNKFFLKIAYKLEAYLYKKSVLVTGQTQGIVADINRRFPKVKTYWLPNGVDLNFYDPNKIKSTWRKDNGFSEGQILILYAGIMGHAQGLEIIVNAAEKLKKTKEVQFIMLGSGPLKKDLEQLSIQKKLDNIHFIDVVPKSEMPTIIKASDIALVPLRKLDLFKGAIPSKIFENLAMEKALLLGVDGEAKSLFIDQGNAGLYFEPENLEQLVECIRTICESPKLINEFGKNGREFVDQKFNRELIAAEFNNELEKLK